MKYDIENVLKKYIPSMIELLGNQKISWTSINRILEKHIGDVKKEYESTKNPVYREATFYSIIQKKLTGSLEADGLFDFFTTLFKTLQVNLSSTEKKSIHRMLSKVLSNPNKDYLNFIGELATLNKYMETGEYELINIEEPINKSKKICADIFFKRKKDNIEILIEVLNLHLETKEFNNFQDLDYHLKSKLNKKIKEKLLNPDRLIFIQPVLWCKDLKQMKFVYDFYVETNFTIENVIIPMTLSTYKDSNGNFEHRFESIKTILKD